MKNKTRDFPYSEVVSACQIHSVSDATLSNQDCVCVCARASEQLSCASDTDCEISCPPQHARTRTHTATTLPPHSLPSLNNMPALLLGYHEEMVCVCDGVGGLAAVRRIHFHFLALTAVILTLEFGGGEVSSSSAAVPNVGVGAPPRGR